ncbi:hypothetical protein NDK47_02125 [Brevibacillus ruminantium]|uniref:Secreted protein n=1 Tax=Brevibacillus ruminantium TaxID=2950604 RepID=A0ABY4WG74_9BACL|nr:hypothetical protein [Brevibacillus ruminantium]USG66156.1 hypothetical protein NDK47_02125 [Brevibacillus ruminantium]
MHKWVLAGIVYVVLVIGGFTVYEQLFDSADQQAGAATAGHAAGNEQAGGHGQGAGNESNPGNVHGNGNESGSRHGAASGTENGHGAPDGAETGHDTASGGDNRHGTEHGHADAAHQEHTGESEVHASIEANASEVKISLKDKAGNPVNELEVNHEKLLHFIIVDQNLEKYYHLHPEQAGDGEFRIAYRLPEGNYKGFVDIKPKDLAYHVEPISFVVGHPGAAASGQGLKPDTALTKTVEGETVKLTMSSFQANHPVQLSFELDQTHLTPYLGAMGHVVILDEKAENFLHVHPADEAKPVFETTFSRAGTYKIWAEFQQNGKVRAFPFVVKITNNP